MYWGKGLAFEMGQASLEYAEEHLNLAGSFVLLHTLIIHHCALWKN
ncbi:GNAT family N-acetyltransferase [Legionella parisiensis]|nr:GNAT family N-acetyltransferase [Legionella parisiensis]